MFNEKSVENISVSFNILGLCGVNIILLIAFFYQINLHEPPCPLCLLQRIGFIMIGCGFFFNLSFGIKLKHYSLILISAIITAAVATRQFLLHILPGNNGYGSTFFSLHFYTWSILASVVVMISTATILVIHDNMKSNSYTPSISSKILQILFIFLIAANLLSTFLECGYGQCSDNPNYYQMLK